MEMWGSVSGVFPDCDFLFYWIDIFLKGCWVTRKFGVLQLVTQYLWVWSALILMLILYTIMFVVMRGWLIIENGVWYWYKNYMAGYVAGSPVEETQEEKNSKAIANSLLL